MAKRWIVLLLLALALSACRAPAAGPGAAGPAGPTQAAGAPEAATQVPVVQPEASSTLPPPPTATNTAVPPTATLLPTATPTPQPVGPDNFPAGVNPLTGLKVADPALLDRRPLAVKIQLFPRGQRMPWGLSQADIVYDFYQNNGMTRLNAIFYGQDAEKVGPIRSARLFDGTIVRMYKAIFAFGGADQRILSQLQAAPYGDRLIMEGSRSDSPMERVEPNTFNFLQTNTAKLSAYAESLGIANERQDLDGMAFDLKPPAGGIAAGQIFAHFSISAYVRWDYDPATGRYLRFQDSQEAADAAPEAYAPLVDRLTNEQYAADNVVVILAPHSFDRTGGGEIVTIKVGKDGVASGEAYLFRDGQAYKVKWSRPSEDAVLTLLTPDGQKPIPFKPGTTWFEVLGQTSKVEQDGTAYRFKLGIP